MESTQNNNQFTVRVKTLLTLRWVAIAGQIVTLMVVAAGLGFNVDVVAIAPLVVASIALNGYLHIFARRTRFSERQIMLFLAFDMVQLTAILFLSGGLQNPFAAMMLIYVTIAAAILSPRGVRVMAVAAFLCLTFLAFIHHPLPWRGGGLLLDRLYSCGVWTALSIACAFISFYVSSLLREARQMSQALAATTEALAREQRFSAMGSLAAVTAHQLATPLNSITLIAHDLLDEFRGQPQLRREVELLVQQSKICRDALAGLSAQAKSLANPESALARLPISAFMELAVDQIPKNSLSVKLDIRRNYDRDIMVLARPEILHAMSNILHNAMLHASSRVELECSMDGEKIYFSVWDDGPGFPSELLPDLGEPYVQRRGAYPGMGLGLFIAVTLVRKLNGSVHFSNHPDGGAEVAVDVPLGAMAADTNSAISIEAAA